MNKIKEKSLKQTIIFEVPTSDDEQRSTSDTQRIMNDTFVKNAYYIGGVKVAYIPVSEMVICVLYQRAPQNKINKIAKTWDIQQCGCIIVSYRDGKFYILDGQNRYLAALQAGEEALPCQIFEDLTVQGEAEVFANQDINKSNLSTFDKFKARLVYEDEVAVNILRICNNYHIKIAKTSASDTGCLKGLDTTERIYRNCGEDCLNWVFGIIHECNWHNVKGGYGDTIMSSLYNIYINHIEELGSIDTKIIKILERTTPDIIIAQASSTFIGRGRKSALTAYIEMCLATFDKNVLSIG